jgi:hypothetical protein
VYVSFLSRIKDFIHSESFLEAVEEGEFPSSQRACKVQSLRIDQYERNYLRNVF